MKIGDRIRVIKVWPLALDNLNDMCYQMAGIIVTQSGEIYGIKFQDDIPNNVFLENELEVINES